MDKNFKFSEFVNLTLESETLDLHNDYDLSEVTINNIDRECCILWKSNQFCRTDISQVLIKFTNVSRLSCNIAFDEDGYALKFAGYLPDDDFGTSSYFISEEDLNKDDHLILAFENNSSISILADSAMATLKRAAES